MFGNSKEYQDLQKLYVDEVSKPENIDEGVKKFLGKINPFKKKKEDVKVTPLSDRDKSDIKKEQDAIKLQKSIKSGEFKKLGAEIEK